MSGVSLKDHNGTERLGSDEMFVDGTFAGDISHVQLGVAPKKQEGPVEVPVTVDKHGEIVGDASHLPAELLAQMSTPEAKAQIASIWRNSHYGKKEPKREPKYLTKGERRDFTSLRPAGMDAKTFKQLRKRQFRKLTKAAIKLTRSNYHG